MAEKLYAIVKFTTENDEVGIISSNWIMKNNRDICYYPNAASEITIKLLKKRSTPTVEWKTYPIKVLKEYETYDDARKNLRKAEETSNLDTDPEISSKRKRRAKVIFGNDSEESDDSPKKFKHCKISPYPSLDSFSSCQQTIKTKSPSGPLLPLGNYTSNSPDISLSQSSNSFIPSYTISTLSFDPVSSQTISTPSFHPAPSQTVSAPTRTSEMDNNRIAIVLAQIQSTVADLVQEVREMRRKLDSFDKNLNSGGQEEEFSNEMKLIGKLPLNTLDDFYQNEENLNEARFNNLLVKILVSLGGRDFRSYTYSILKRLMTCELANNFSFTGKQAKDKEKERKHPFCSTLLYKVYKLL